MKEKEQEMLKGSEPRAELLPGEVREGGLEEVTSEWGFAGVPDKWERRSRV